MVRGDARDQTVDDERRPVLLVHIRKLKPDKDHRAAHSGDAERQGVVHGAPVREGEVLGKRSHR